MRIIPPPRLRTGDVIGIIAPSEAVEERADIARTVRFLARHGFKTALGKHLFARHTSTMAGTARERADDLHRMFGDRRIRAIVCAAGGTAANQLLPLLDVGLIARNPKIFLGYSDTTILLNAITATTGLVTFHGPHAQVGIRQLPPRALAQFLQLLTVPKPFGILPRLTPWRPLRRGSAMGRLVGGNLTSLGMLLGTPWAPRFRSGFLPGSRSILFLEEWTDEPCDIHQKCMHLATSGMFDRIDGMIVGKCIRCDNRSYRTSLTARQTVATAVAPYRFPVLTEVDIGHVRAMLTLPIGVRTYLRAHTGTIELLERAVS